MVDDVDGKRYDPRKIAACVDECREHHNQTLQHLATIEGIKGELKAANFDKFGARVQKLLTDLDAQQKRVLAEFSNITEHWGDFGREAGTLSEQFVADADTVDPALRRALG